MTHRLLVINPGSTSTKIGVYDDEQPLFVETLRHSSQEIAAFPHILDQCGYAQALALVDRFDFLLRGEREWLLGKTAQRLWAFE